MKELIQQRYYPRDRHTYRTLKLIRYLVDIERIDSTEIISDERDAEYKIGT